jgi:hypothetical protein
MVPCTFTGCCHITGLQAVIWEIWWRVVNESVSEWMGLWVEDREWDSRWYLLEAGWRAVAPCSARCEPSGPQTLRKHEHTQTWINTDGLRSVTSANTPPHTHTGSHRSHLVVLTMCQLIATIANKHRENRDYKWDDETRQNGGKCKWTLSDERDVSTHLYWGDGTVEQ